MCSYPMPRNGILSIDYEFILLFKKLGSPEKPDEKMKKFSRMSKEEWKEYFSGHWNFGGAKQDGHIAVFPEELPKRLIKMFAYAGDTFLDPFLGSGTTSLAAKNLGRNSFGYEINPEFISIIKNKLQVNKPDLIGTEYVYFSQKKRSVDFDKKIRKLPYIFKDFHSFDKKIDPKKLQFGSKIDNNSGHREEYFTVKEIVSPEIVKLSNDLVIRLIGVRENKTINDQAIEFLRKKTHKQQVFIKFDEKKYDDNNNLLCYLYLKNKTFLNAHLVKNGLVFIDQINKYKYKSKFLKLMNGDH